MLCLQKIHHRPLTYLFFAFVFSCFLSALGSVSDSYATSGTCTLEFTIFSNYNSNTRYVGNCYNNWAVGYYIRPVTVSFDVSAVSSNPTYFYIYGGYSNRLTLFQLGNFPLSISDFDISSWTFFTLLNSYKQITYPSSGGTGGSYWSDLAVGFNQKVSGTVYITYEYTDSFGNNVCPEPEEPEPCPPIPENPYDEKLDDIRKAILTVGAILIMIYFFICLYKIVNKDGGSRR